MTEHPDWDGEFDDHMQCPHCGERDYEYCEYPCDLDRDGATSEANCSSCGEDYRVTVSVSYSYATQPLFIGPKVNPVFRYNLTHFASPDDSASARGKVRNG